MTDISYLPLDAHDLTQRVDHLHQVALRVHHCVDVLVSHGRLVDHPRILATLDALGCLHVIGERVALLGSGARQNAPRTMAAATEALRVTLATHDERSRAHAAGDDAQLSLTRPHRALARHEHVLAVVALSRH